MTDEGFELPPEVFGQVPLFAEIAKVLSWSGGPVNWDIARQIAVAVAGKEAASTTDADTHEAVEDVRVAELWLAEATGLPQPATLAVASAVAPAEYAARAIEAYQEIVDPLARRVAGAMGAQQIPGVEGAEQQAIAGMIGQISPFFLGIQAGVAIGSLSTSILGRYDVPIPAAEEGEIVVLPRAIDAFAADFGVDRREAGLWVALHECAHRLELEGAGWVRTHFFSQYHNYVTALDFDLGGLFEKLQGMNVADPAAMQEALGDAGLFAHVETDASRAARERVAAFVAILEAYADRAVEAAVSRLPSGGRLAEAAARRRAAPPQGERMFSQFLGLAPEPDRRRAADAFTRAVLDSAGWPALNRLWLEPEDLPTDAEIADPPAWLARVGRA